MAWQAASAATMVLPLPTSPWSSRCIGWGRVMSAAISSTTRCCAPVNRNGSAARNLVSRPSARRGIDGAFFSRRAACERRSEICWASNSSNLIRCQAGCERSASAASLSCGGGLCSRRRQSASGASFSWASGPWSTACGRVSGIGVRDIAPPIALRR
ncbi:hypothetical protein D3C86_1309550 [compost metagenome]